MAKNCFPSRITSSTYLRGILPPAFRSLICLCQTSWAQNCNQIMHVEQSMMGSHCGRIVRPICWCLLACYLVCEGIHVQFCQWPIDFLEVWEEQHSTDTLILFWDSSSDHQQRIMGSCLYEHTDGDQIHPQALLR